MESVYFLIIEGIKLSDEYPVRRFSGRRRRRSDNEYTYRPYLDADVQAYVWERAQQEGVTPAEMTNTLIREAQRLKKYASVLSIIEGINWDALNQDSVKSAVLMLLAGAQLARIGTDVGQRALLLAQQTQQQMIMPQATAVVSPGIGAIPLQQGERVENGKSTPAR